MQIKVSLVKDGELVKRIIKLNLYNIERLEAMTDLGAPMGIMQALKDGKLGIGFCADVISLGLRYTGDKYSRGDIISMMEGLAADDNLIPCVQAVCLATGREDLAKLFQEETTPEGEEEEEGKGKGSAKGDSELNPTQVKET